jgi:hypothetical protein
MKPSSAKENAVKLRLIVLVLALSAFGAAAQTIYKSTMPDGKVIYGEKPAPGAQKVETLEPPPATTGVTAVTPEEQARARDARKPPANATARTREVEDARLKLQKAEAARDAGKEPLPGERIGRAGGGSRLSEEYFARQKSLEEAVDAARKRVEEIPR